MEIHDEFIFGERLELDRSISRMVCIYHALSHPVRLTICRYLVVCPRSVTDICNFLELKQYVVSQQLAVLRRSNVVETKRVSRNVIYRLRSKVVRRILNVNKKYSDIEQNERFFCETAEFLAPFETAKTNW